MNLELDQNPEPARLNPWPYAILALTMLLTVLGSYLLYDYYSVKILPRTTINGVAVGGLTIEQATEKIAATTIPPENHELKIFVDDIAISTASASLDVAYQFDETTKQAFTEGKNGRPIERFFNILTSFFKPTHFQAELEYNEEKLAAFITDLKLDVDVIGEEPSAMLEATKNPPSIKINPGLPGRVLETDKTVAEAQKLLKEEKYQVAAVVASTSAQLSEEQQEQALERSKKLVSKSLELVLDADKYVNLEISDKVLISFLNFPQPDSYKLDVIQELIDTWEKSVNREPQSAVLEYDKDTLKVKKFLPHKLGLELDSQKIADDVLSKLAEIEVAEETEKQELIAISVTTEPETPLEKTNPLGIKERIGYGESEYDHSIPNRIHNVSITTDRVSNIIVAPGEEFSFNKTLGEVSARTGYRSAYVIKNGRTELGDGGGVCQVSTTLFRSVLNAGLDVTLRLPHSYRVSYYELDSKPGIDATVYSGNVDFRFKNDTDHHILIHGEADSKNLTMFYEIYGTSDGRTAQITSHRVWDARPAPESQYFDDPTLPAGTVKQIDFATGGVKASFKNVIKDKNGKIIREDEYYSNYRPWSAKYLRGTGT